MPSLRHVKFIKPLSPIKIDVIQIVSGIVSSRADCRAENRLNASRHFQSAITFYEDESVEAADDANIQTNTVLFDSLTIVCFSTMVDVFD